MSSGNGGGKGFFDNIVNVESLSGGGNFFENLGKDILNAGVQSATAGFVGVEDGKLSNGVTTNWYKKLGKEVVSGTKEITGAKAAEQANKEARRQFDTQREDMFNERNASIQRTARDQMQQSQMAQGVRSAGTANKNTGSSQILGSYERDFLGL